MYWQGSGGRNSKVNNTKNRPLHSAEEIDWQGKAVSFLRRETATVSIIRFGEGFETVLRTLPQAGELCLKDPQPPPPTERAERRRRAKRTRLWSNRFSIFGHSPACAMIRATNAGSR